MTSVIPSDDKAEFQHKCKKLLTVGEVEFFEIAADIQRKWPRTQTWMNWWLIPENAQMLFGCMRKMTPALAAKLPDTTNAEEAMHATIYHGVGKGLMTRIGPIIPGLVQWLVTHKDYAV